MTETLVAPEATASTEDVTTEAQDTAAQTPMTQPVLEWLVQDEGSWYAANTAGVIYQDEELGGMPAVFMIDRIDTGTVTFYVDSADNLLTHEVPPASQFQTLEAAKAFCEARNAELVAAKTPAPTNEPAAAVDDKPGCDGVPDNFVIDPDAWEEIRRARRDEREAEESVASLTESLKYAKKRHDGASERLGRLIDDAQSGQKLLPFGAAKAETPLATGKADQKITENITAPASNDSWKLVRLDTLSIKPATLAKLADHEPKLETIGELSAWMEAKTEYWAKDIKGIGAKAREEIEDAMANYWTAHPRDGAAPAPAAESPAPAVPAPMTRRLSGLGVTEADILAAFDASLPTTLQAKGTAAIPGVLQLPSIEGTFVAIKPVDAGGAKYELLRLLLVDDTYTDNPSVRGLEDGLVGYPVRFGSSWFAIGAKALRVLVTV